MKKPMTKEQFTDLSSATMKSGEGSDKSTASLLDLFQCHWQELCGYLREKYSSTSIDTEDAAQSAFLKLAEQKDLSSIQNAKAYLYQTARNNVIDSLRRKQTHTRYAVEQVALNEKERSAVLPIDRVIIGKEDYLALEKAIRGLEQRERDFLLMHRLHNMSYTDIARRAGMSRNGVKAIIKKALAKCAKETGYETVNDNSRSKVKSL